MNFLRLLLVGCLHLLITFKSFSKISTIEVIDGEPINIRYALWSVGIYDNDGNFRGTGTVIGRLWVLTAAHVAQHIGDNGFVVAGLTYLNRRTDDQIYHPVENGVIIHEGFDRDADPEPSPDDVALIQLNRDLPENMIIRFAANEDHIEVGTQVTFAGYGQDYNGMAERINEGQNRINEVNATVNDADGFFVIRRPFNPDGSPQATMRRGDSGAPIWIIQDGSPLLLGVHTYGRLEVNYNIPINRYAAWIEEHTGIRALEEDTNNDDNTEIGINQTGLVVGGVGITAIAAAIMAEPANNDENINVAPPQQAEEENLLPQNRTGRRSRNVSFSECKKTN